MSIFVLLQKARHIYISENPKLVVQFCLKLFNLCSNNKTKCLGLQMARIEMEF